MSTPRREPRRIPEALDLWYRAVDLRTEWLTHATSTAPADREATEDAITRLYALVGAAPPEFVWVASPAAAVKSLPPPQTLSLTHDVPVEGRLATAVSSLRQRLDRRCGMRPASTWMSTLDPVSALRSGNSLRGVINDGLRPTLRRTVLESVAAQIRGTIPEPWLGLHWYGQQDAYWVAPYDIHRRVDDTRFEPADVAQLELWATLTRSCGWWWPRENRCVVAERPLAVRTELLQGTLHAEARLHDATGPAVAYPDGWTVHAWHGTRVPSWVIEEPTADRIDQEPNVEVRRCAIEHLGWTGYIDQAGLTLLNRAPDPGNPGSELRLYTLPREKWRAPTRLLLAVNGSVERDGTRRRYGLRVPAQFDHPLDAAGWTYGLTGAQYAQLQRRT